MRTFHIARTARLVAVLAVALLLGCSKSSDSTAPPAITGPRWDLRFTSAGPNGTSQKLVFTDVGTWNYQCTPHGSSQGMTGTVTVSAAGTDSVAVSIVNFAFQPSAVNIKPGGYVRWHNESNRTDHTSTR